MNQKMSKPMLKSIIANIFNLILIIGIVILLRKLPTKAQAIKELENTQAQAQESIDVEVLNADLAKHKNDISSLDSLFTDNTQILKVIESLSNFKNSGLITEFNIADSPIKDSSGQIGLPVFIKGSGSKEAVDVALSSLHSMGKIVKPIKLNLVVNENINFEYTGFLLMQ